MKTNMKFYAVMGPVAALLLALSSPINAANAADDSTDTDDVSDNYVSDNELERVSVLWIKPKSFTDVRDANSSRERFRKRVFSELEKHLDKLAKDLPEGQFLKVSVSNVDLAGRIEPASFIGLSNRMDDVRILRNIDIPRIDFSYELVDAAGNILKSEDVKLKDMGYLQSIGFLGRDRPFAYEKRMLSKWFTKTIIEDDA